MRRFKADVSHRIRPKSPSIFTAVWFRTCLGIGLAVVVGLVLGLPIAGRLGADLPQSVLRLSPWGATEPGAPVADGVAGSVGGAATREGASLEPAATEAPAVSGEASPSGADRAANRIPGATAGSGTVAPGARSAPAPVEGSAAAAAGPLPSAGPASATGGAESGPAGPPLYWIQVGAFLDHRNADRLVERLRGEGLSAGTVVLEQSRVLYRVLVVPADGASVVPDPVLDKVRTLGFTVEQTDAGPAATGVVPMRTAVEASHRLRDQGVPVRLKQEVGSAAFRVVRVGSFGTSGQAEEILASLQAKGIEGFVVRDR
jgi:cell division septation protein DedD